MRGLLTRREILKLGAAALGGMALTVGGRVASPLAPEADSAGALLGLGLREAKSGSGGDSKSAPVPKWQNPLPNALDLRLSPNIVKDPAGRVLYHEYSIVQRQGQADFGLGNGRLTRIWGYNGQFPGPTIEAPHGVEIRMTQANDLRLGPDSHGHPWVTSVHYHGGITEPEHDGYAGNMMCYNPDGTPEIDPVTGKHQGLPTELTQGRSWTYVYPNRQTATTNFYHCHGVHHTSENVYRGLVGFYLQRDDSERWLQDNGYLPTYPHEVVMALQDKKFDLKTGQLIYDAEKEGFSGVVGNVQTVNGKAWPRMKVEPRKYRFRILNGNIWRRYDLRLSNGRPFLQLGTDSGFLNAPVSTKSIRLFFAERVDTIVDFAGLKPGTIVTLLNKARESADTSMEEVVQFEVVGAPAGMVDVRLPDKDAFQRAGIGWEVLTDAKTVQAALDYMKQNKINREFRFERSNGMYVINDKIWDPNRFDAEPRLGTTEVWTFRNPSGGWYHPVHMHLIDFQLIDRNGRSPYVWERGRKDTTALGEGETIRVIVKWDAAKYLNFTGPYMFHCHNTDHEDHDMMTQFKVVR